MKKESIKFIDLFCGVGGFRQAMDDVCRENNLTPECVLSSDIDTHCQDSYELNFGDRPIGDITEVDERDVPNHDVLFAGFPCQPFSIIGQMKGFNDIRGTLFFDITRIIKEKQPTAFVLENVKQLVGHNKGETLKTIIKSLEKLNYHVYFDVLNALDYGLPQKRERVIIVGHKKPILFNFPSPESSYKPLSSILEKKVDEKYQASDYIVNKRKDKHQSKYKVAIWHENKSGNVSSYPYSCALRSDASHNYLLVNGERRLTPRELFRLQGFPDTYKITTNDGQAKRQAGNAVPVNLVKAVILKLLPFISTSLDETRMLRESEVLYNEV